MDRLLDYLFSEYTKFLSVDAEQQQMLREFNQGIQHECKSNRTLRELYIELMWCHQMLALHNQQEGEWAVRVKVIESMIGRREEQEESVTPDPKIQKAVAECQGDATKLLQILLQDMPVVDRSRVEPRLRVLLEKYRGQPDVLPNRLITYLCRNLPRTHASYPLLVRAIECILLFHTPSQPVSHS
jgi:hypothetical protein